MQPQAEQKNARNDLLETQRMKNPYHRFVDDNLIIRSGILEKKRGMFTRRRMFLLTEGPHLYYVNPDNMELKGEVPWSSAMACELRSFNLFLIHTPNRTYYLSDPLRHAHEWVEAIRRQKEKYAELLDALNGGQTVDPSIYKKKKSSPKKNKKKDKEKKTGSPTKTT